MNQGKPGKVLPVKWQLQDAGGTFVSDLGAVVRVLVRASSCTSFSNDPTGAVGVSTRGGGLQYDSAANAYSFKWSTASLGAGCYSLLVELDSGQILAAWFRLA